MRLACKHHLRSQYIASDLQWVLGKCSRWRKAIRLTASSKSCRLDCPSCLRVRCSPLNATTGLTLSWFDGNGEKLLSWRTNNWGGAKRSDIRDCFRREASRKSFETLPLATQMAIATICRIWNTCMPSKLLISYLAGSLPEGNKLVTHSASTGLQANVNDRAVCSKS